MNAIQEIELKLNKAIQEWNKTKHNKFYNQIIGYETLTVE